MAASVWVILSGSAYCLLSLSQFSTGRKETNKQVLTSSDCKIMPECFHLWLFSLKCNFKSYKITLSFPKIFLCQCFLMLFYSPTSPWTSKSMYIHVFPPISETPRRLWPYLKPWCLQTSVISFRHTYIHRYIHTWSNSELLLTVHFKNLSPSSDKLLGYLFLLYHLWQ